MLETYKSLATTPDIKFEKPEKRIIVGVDFGTSSTKVMFRPLDDPASIVHLINFAHENRTYPSYAMPSTLRIDDKNQLWFGTLAEESENGKVFRNLKLCVACQIGAVECRHCFNKNLEFGQEYFCFDDYFDVPAYELVIYFLAWLFGILEREILNIFQNDFRLTIQYNIGVPVSHSNEKRNFIELFELIVFVADLLKGRIYQGIHFDKARSELIKILPRFQFPSVENRKHRAVPETVAAAMWLSKSAGDEINNYLIIDIGAGTTDITLYRYSNTNYDKFPIYGTDCLALAGDDFLTEFIQWLSTQYQSKRLISTADIIKKVRDAINRLPSPSKSQKYTLGHTIIELDFDTYKEKILLENFNKIYQAVDKTFQSSYQKDKAQSKWSKMKIVLIGGGSKIPGIENLFKNRQLRPFIEQQFVEPNIPPNAKIIMNNLNFKFLVVAYGLSFPVAELPSIRWPEEIKPQKDSPNNKKEKEYEILDLYRE